MRAPFYLILVPFGISGVLSALEKITPPQDSLALSMLDSIIAQEQGVAVNASVKTSVIEAGLLLTGLREVLHHLDLSSSAKTKYETYADRVMSGLIPALANVTADRTSPLDEFSVGSEIIRR
jgi:unsaturated rhamnogalacturonyl hydrolase